jgi:hypothetical protein
MTTEHTENTERPTTETDALVPQFLAGGEIPDIFALARKLERERNEARAVADELASVAAHCLGSHIRKSPANFIKIAAALKRWKKSK